MEYTKELHDALTNDPTCEKHDFTWGEVVPALLLEIERLQKLHEWIPVTPKTMPEDYQPVLFYSKLIDEQFKGCHISKIPEWVSNGGIFFHTGNYSWITHWKPLPLPPQEQP